MVCRITNRQPLEGDGESNRKTSLPIQTREDDGLVNGKILLSVVSVVATSLFLSSCVGLNEAAKSVKYSTKSEASKDCKEIGEVSVGSIVTLYTIESVKNAMRNKTTEMGGNFLVIDEVKSVSSGSGVSNTAGGTSGYTGSGRAYQCPRGGP